MATIPVEKKTATPWWLWLLGLLLLALLIWFFFLKEKEEPVTTDTTEQTPVATTASLDLSNVWVTRVVDANTFFVAADSAGMPETLVRIDGADQTTAPAVGQNVSVAGVMEPIASTDYSAWGLSDEMAALMTPETMYVRATGMTMLSPAMMDDITPADTAGAMMMPDAPAAPSTGTITRTDDLYGTDLKPIIGRSVELADATVLSVVGDSTFYVGSGGKRFLVALSQLGESQSGPGDGSDGVFKIEAGQRISLRGTVRAFDTASPVFRGLSAADRTDATTRGAFVNVTRAADLVKK